MAQSVRPTLLSDPPEDEPWPPVAPDILDDLEVEMPELAVSFNSMLYKVRGRPTIVYKMKGNFREYQLQEAAGDCAIPVRGRVLCRGGIGNGRVYVDGFLMDLGTPLFPPSPSFSPSRRRDIMHQIIETVERLHTKGIVHGDIRLENMLLDQDGIVRLCDFGEGRYVDEDEGVWEGASTWHFESPNRLIRAEELARDPPPPILEDDLYGLGLSIWQLHTGRIPHEDTAGDDLELKERQRNGGTVSVAEVHDEEARGIITNLLRAGGARV